MLSATLERVAERGEPRSHLTLLKERPQTLFPRLAPLQPHNDFCTETMQNKHLQAGLLDNT